ncbi:MAG: hypothetical protein ACAI38_10750 [Myxococcota bacterium]|nr:hypothetical protein [Myxococcota bacterium]
MHALVEAAHDLCSAVDGVDWSAAEVRDCGERLAGAADVTPEVLAEACAVLIERLKHSAVDDADGASQVAIAAGTLVERGAPADPLARILRAHLPSVLLSARRFADRCLEELPPPSDDGDDPDDETLIQVDDRCISGERFRELLPLDRSGGCALVYLEQWVLPAIASLSRCRPELVRAQADKVLREAAVTMSRSDAHFLPVLLDAELGQRWTVHVPGTRRSFEVELEGVVSNFDLHALLAAALVPLGVPGTAPSPALLAFIEGHGPAPPDGFVGGTWNLYDHRALAHDVSDPRGVPHECWIWGEGRPAHVIQGSGQRTIVVGPAAYERTWNVGRVFSALPQSLKVLRELPSSG